MDASRRRPMGEVMSQTFALPDRLLAGGVHDEPRLVEVRLVHRTEVSHDRVTGLARRCTLVAQIARSLDAASGTSAQVGVVACAIDDLDDVERRHGPVVRTEVVVEAAARLRRVVGGDDVPALVTPHLLVAVALRSSTFEVEAAATAISRALRAPIPTSTGAVVVRSTTRALLARPDHDAERVLTRLVGPATVTR